MQNPSTSVFIAPHSKDNERARLKKITLKWAKIVKNRAMEDFSTQNAPRDMVPPIMRAP